jgi:hypothetical protein
MMELLGFVTSSLFGNVLATVVLGIIVIVLYRIHTSTKNNIDFTDLLVNPFTGKIGGSEFRINAAFLATTWALIFLTLKGSLTEWYLGAYLTAFVADRVFSRNSSIKETTNVSTKKAATPAPAGTDGDSTDYGTTTKGSTTIKGTDAKDEVQ